MNNQIELYDKERTLRVINSERLLKRVYDRSQMNRAFDKDITVKSIFNSLIKPDKTMMEKYRLTHQE